MASPDCHAFRRDAIAQPDRLSRPTDVVDGAVDPGDHAQDCSDCAQWLDRQRLIVGLLGQLDRFAAPEALGRAVEVSIAAQEQREQALETLPRHSAPHVLQRLVDEEVEAGASAIVARVLAGLERQKAPAELEQLVHERIAEDRLTERADDTARAGTDGQRLQLLGTRGRPVPIEFGATRRQQVRIGLVAAAAIVVIALPPLVLGGAFTPRAATPGDELRPAPRVRLVMVASPDELSPLARSLAMAVTGGQPAAVRPEEEVR